ncbi:MAG: PepSY domain-containing protein, partial [Verrucomicrobiota bacterium]
SFKFTVEQLLEKLEQQEDTIDIFYRTSRIHRSLENDFNRPVWSVNYQKFSDRIEVVFIDGVTGEILGRDYYLYEDN